MADDHLPEDEAEFDEEDAELADDIEPEDLDEDLDEEDVLADEDEDEFATADEDDALIDEDEEAEAEGTARRAAVVEEEDDDEDLVDPDDVEADLDTILKDRLVAAEDEPEPDEDEVEVDDRGDPVDRIQPKRPGEFVCQSCFLVKHPGQLADAKRMLCADCV